MQSRRRQLINRVEYKMLTNNLASAFNALLLKLFFSSVVFFYTKQIILFYFSSEPNGAVLYHSRANAKLPKSSSSPL